MCTFSQIISVPCLQIDDVTRDWMESEWIRNGKGQRMIGKNYIPSMHRLSLCCPYLVPDQLDGCYCATTYIGIENILRPSDSPSSTGRMITPVWWTGKFPILPVSVSPSHHCLYGDLYVTVMISPFLKERSVGSIASKLYRALALCILTIWALRMCRSQLDLQRVEAWIKKCAVWNVK